MSTTASLKCKYCGKYNEVDACFFDDFMTSNEINLSFHCGICGKNNIYSNLTQSELEEIINPSSELERQAEFLGISAAKLSAYVYPPDVMKEADLDRRKIRGLSIKEYLKSCRQSYPKKEGQNWWLVYQLKTLDAVVFFRRDFKSYRLLDGKGIYLEFGNIIELGDYVRERI
ncbi:MULTISPECIES: hypothetical protein [unclassified Shewanella]|uniref:hypothetical protein n=1 Tax=unclassified Shewanella TaxID=196818 RepID=UPI0021DA6E9E|nr:MULTISPECIES: hypothetical protein [unclassified Shewanella]MCU8021547.1 hypothetical protein [Shewanella sp. SM78]MCU8078744.1 hypothetical protein [Shewanella sp. SM103]